MLGFADEPQTFGQFQRRFWRSAPGQMRLQHILNDKALALAGGGRARSQLRVDIPASREGRDVWSQWGAA
jgi:hypothetical protein